MFLQVVLHQITGNRPLRVLDLCAAPGGKSTLLASSLPEGSLLVSNEVIKSRASILKENIIKWGGDQVVVTNSDPNRFSSMKGAFDVILVDAPCSGEGMFRKDEKPLRSGASRISAYVKNARKESFPTCGMHSPQTVIWCIARVPTIPVKMKIY